MQHLEKFKVEGYVPDVGLCFRSEINKNCKSFQKQVAKHIDGGRGGNGIFTRKIIKSKISQHPKVLRA